MHVALFLLGLSSLDIALTPEEALAPAVVLEDRREVSHLFKRGGGGKAETAEKIRRAIYIVNEAGLEFADVKIAYTGQEWINGLRARTFTPDGAVHEVEAVNIIDTDEVLVAGRGKNSQRSKTFAFPRAVPGSVVEYEYTLKRRNWIFAMTHYVYEDVPVREAVFSVDLYRDSTLKHQSSRFGEPAVSKDEYSWTARNVPAAPQNILSPPARDLVPWISFSVDEIDYDAAVRDGRGNFIRWQKQTQDVYAGWPEVGGSLWSGMDDQSSLLVEVERPSGNTTEVIGATWNLVQNSIHDRRGVLMGSSRSLTDVWKSGFGATFERALLLFTLLKRWDVPVGILFMPGPYAADVDADLPTPDRLNEILVYAIPPDAEPIILDPGCLGCAPGDVLLRHQARTGLLAIGKKLAKRWSIDTSGFAGGEEKEHEAWVKIYATPPDSSRSLSAELRLDIDVTPRGLIASKGSWTARGIRAAAMRHYLAQNPMGQAGREEALREKYLDGIEEGRIDFAGVENIGEPIQVLVENVLLSRSGYLRAGGWLTVPIRSLTRDAWMEALEADREVPLFFDDPPDYERIYVVAPPDGYRIAELPRDAKVASPSGRYELDVHEKDGTLEITETLHVEGHRFTGDAYAQLFSFLSNVREERRQAIVMKISAASVISRAPKMKRNGRRKN